VKKIWIEREKFKFIELPAREKERESKLKFDCAVIDVLRGVLKCGFNFSGKVIKRARY
jgi:hypothetical protein